QTLLSPENYIRQKSRSLPIVKCSVNKNWELSGLASIFIVRRHSNGNFTFCTYLVDKDCLGVKDTMYYFNEPQERLDEYEEKVISGYEPEEISYDLAHNIIFAAIEFAEEYGFKPHRDFTAVTQYFLEEDDDSIPIIDIHCGNKNGEPVYVNNGYETPALQQRIINQLEKTAGNGNYEVYINADDNRLGENYLDEDEFEEDDDEDEIYNRWYDIFEEMDNDEFNKAAYETFLEWKKFSGGEKINNEEEEIFNKARALTNILYDFNYDMIDLYHEKITNDLENIDVIDDKKVPNSLFPTFTKNDEELVDNFLDNFFEIHNNTNKKEVQKAIAEFELKYGDCGALAYMKFISSSKENQWDDIEKELKKFPDYFLLKMLQVKIETNEMPSEARQKLLELVKDRTLTNFEMSQFLLVYAIRIFKITQIDTPDLVEKLDALETVLTNDFAEEQFGYFMNNILLTMVRSLKINNIISQTINDK
ncbi:MAG: hypothetical protein LBH32_14860, partial [Dysgonamonadaceae bacterium]|nr:hypothetical protein [Dysgonamonadaceae bacterium]